MVQLLNKLHIRAADSKERLLSVIKNPVTDHIPVGCVKIGTSHSAKNLVHLPDFVKTLPSDTPIVFVIGAMAHGKVNVDYIDQEISFSSYPLSASVACGKVCCAYEDLWNIL